MDYFLTFAVVLFIGFLLSFFLYHRFRMRIPGVIATPLLAVYTMESPLILPLTIAVSVIIYGILHFIFIKYYIYGRRLFLLGCALSIVISVPILFLLNLTNVIFLTILPGIFAYNEIVNVEHRVRSIAFLAGELGVLIGVGTLLSMFF